MMLYKYCRYSEHLLGCLAKDTIWLSAPEKFNDIFDCQFTKDEFTLEQLQELQAIKGYRKSLAKKHDIALRGIDDVSTTEDMDVWTQKEFTGIKEFISEFGIMSLSEIPDSLLLWAHYGNNHTGVCLEYEVNDESSLIPVTYSTQYPKLSIYEFGIDIVKSTDSILATKSMEWAYEKEWRYVKGGHSNKEIKSPFKLTSIIFGARISAKHIETIKAITSMKEIGYVYAKQSEHSFLLNLIKEE